MESIPSGLKGSSNSLAASGAPRAADGGCFAGVLCQEAEAEVMGGRLLQSLHGALRCRLIAAVMSLEGSAVSARGRGRIGVD